MSRKRNSVAFRSWSATPRGITRQNEADPQTIFDRFGTPEMRLYLHILKLRRDPYDYVEVNTLKLRRLVGLYKREFERARDQLVNWELITATPVDARKESYRYRFTEDVTTLAPMLGNTYDDEPVMVPVPRDQMAAALSMNGNLDGKRRRKR